MGLDRTSQIDVTIGEIRTMETVQIGTRNYLYTQSNDPLGGIGVYRVLARGDVKYVGQSFNAGDLDDGFYLESHDHERPSGLTTVTYQTGETFLVATGHFAHDTLESRYSGTHLFELSSDGTPSLNIFYYRDLGADIQLDGRVRETTSDSLIFQLYDLGAASKDQLVVTYLTSTGEAFRSEYHLKSRAADELFLLTDDENPTFFYLSDDSGRIKGLRFDPVGLDPRNKNLSGSGSLPAEKIATDMQAVDVKGEHFVITTNPLDGLRSFSYGVGVPYRILESHIDSNEGSKSWAAEEIETFEIGDRGFVVTGGDKITVFEVESDSTFTNAGRKGRLDGTVRDIEVVVKDGKAVITVATDTGLESFVFVPGVARDITGTAGRDIIRGDGRDNTLDGLTGADKLRGLEGDDVLVGGAGFDTLKGDRGADILVGGTGNDLAYGGIGNDSIIGGFGFDTIYGGNGADRVRAEHGNDIIHGQNGDDWIDGGDGFDRITGGNGHDQIVGGYGRDIIYGGSGNDRLFGGKGDDRIIDGAGFDTLSGKAGTDELVLIKDGSDDVIEDWFSGDVINLAAFGPSLDFDDLRFETLDNGQLRVDLGDEYIFFGGMFIPRRHDFSEDDFIFA